MTLVITPGDPRGIGPEVTIKALLHKPVPRAILVGDVAVITQSAQRYRLPIVPITQVEALRDGQVGVMSPPPGSEAVEVRALRTAVSLCLQHRVSAMVTGPIHKARLAKQGFAWMGHTDFLAHLCGVTHPVMAFVGGRLRVALVTVHMPLREVAEALTTTSVYHTIQTAHRALLHDVGIQTPHITVCGLNPHAGDDGLLGAEEHDIIVPAIRAAQAQGIHAHGAVSAETAFRWAITGRTDLVVAMYHDQGLAPLKVVDFGQSVNWTLGLPIIRTSVDHGTADDLVGRDLADPSSMVAAIAWAQELASQRAKAPAHIA